MAQDAKLDMSLDQLIQQSRNPKKGGAGSKPAAGKAKGKTATAAPKNLPKGKPLPQGKQQQQGKGNVRVVPRNTGGRAPTNLRSRGGGVQKGGGRPAPVKQFVQRGGGMGRGGAPTYMPRMKNVQLVPRYPVGMGGMAAMGNMGMGMGSMMGMGGMQAGNMGMGQQGRMMAGGMGGMRPQGKWQHDMYNEQQPEPELKITSSKLFVSNLDFKVSDDDIKELFSNCGPLKEWGIHFDKSGRSLGTAHVEFARAAHAEEAFKKYNNVALDGKKMVIEIVETKLPPGTIRTLNSGIHVQKAAGGFNAGGGGAARGGFGAGAGMVRGRGMPMAGAGDFMQE